jgi:hypothetical protein
MTIELIYLDKLDVIGKGKEVLKHFVAVAIAVTMALHVSSIRIYAQNQTQSSSELQDYIILNDGNLTEQKFQQMVNLFGAQSNKKTPVGLGTIVSLLNASPTNYLIKLNSSLAWAQKYDIPIQIKFDTEYYWDYRIDLWNFWDPARPGYNPDNKYNVEWTSWNPDSAVKITWLNWGRQIRKPPAPNFMSPKYREAWKTELVRGVEAVKKWYNQLPEDKKYLFAGIVVGWESSIGVNLFHYPNGNNYLDKAESNDPLVGRNAANPNLLPSRGIQTIGYAAVSTAKIKTSGTLTEADQAEVVRRHLEDHAKTVFDAGIPRELIFSHAGGWAPGETLYSAAVNSYSCPGWSFYKYASDPRKDMTAMQALGKSDAPCWGAVEWLFGGTGFGGEATNEGKEKWVTALTNALVDKSRVVSIYNLDKITPNQNAINGIKQMNEETKPTPTPTPQG